MGDPVMKDRLWCLDIETGGLEFGKPVIEVAYGPVFRDEVTVLWNRSAYPEICDPEALEINRCFAPDRHHHTGERRLDQWQMACAIHYDLRDKVLVAANPQFDTGHLTALLELSGLLPTWSYRLVDIKSLVVGWAAGTGRVFTMPEKGWGQREVAALIDIPPIPEELAHTAAGDLLQLRQMARRVLG